jgi:hypothetical protein
MKAKTPSICVMTVLVLSAINVAWCDVRLPMLVGSGMVLQRDTKIGIWGWADPAESVRVEFRVRSFRQKRIPPDIGLFQWAPIRLEGHMR